MKCKYIPWNKLSEERREYLRKYRRDLSRTRYASDAAYRELMKSRSRKYHHSNIVRCNLLSKQHYQDNKADRLAKSLVYNNNRRKTDLNFKLKTALRHRIWSSLKSCRANKSNRTVDLLGCSIESFKIYIESLFTDGMSWENYGRYGWHIDHIMPCAIFDLTKPEHQKRCFHFSNLQPLWASENLKKNSCRRKSCL